MNIIGALEFLVSYNEFVSQAINRICAAKNIKQIPRPTYNP